MDINFKDYLIDQWYEINPEVEDSLQALLSTNKSVKRTCPVGYDEHTDIKTFKRTAIPNPVAIKILLQVMADHRYLGKRSLREALAHCNHLFSANDYDNTISTPGGLSLIFKRLEQALGIYQGTGTSRDRMNKHRAERREKRKAEGLSENIRNLSKSAQERQYHRQQISLVNKEIAKLDKARRTLKQRAARNGRKLKMKTDPTKYIEDLQAIYNRCEKYLTLYINDVKEKQAAKNKVQLYLEALQRGWTEEQEDELLAMYRSIIEDKDKYDNRQIAFLPTPRQHLFLSSPEDIVLYGGAAGGGKSYAMVIDPLRYAHIKDHNAVIIRKTMPELTELIDTSRELYPLVFPGAKYKETEHAWYFPSGAKIRFGYLDKPADKYKYQGRAFSYIGFDELSQHTTDEGFMYLKSRLRRTNPEIYPYIRATANPGSQWVYEQFIQPKEPGQPFILKGTENSPKPITMKFIPAKLSDNPHLDSDGMYRSMLEGLSEVERRQLLDGDWLASNDAMFPEFNIMDHVVEPFYIPAHWNRVAGLDYGYRDPSAAVWFAVDPEDGSLVIYDEFLQSGLTGREFALKVMEKESNELVPVDHPIDWSIYAKTGHTGPTIAESMLSVPGFRIRRADKNREAGWVQIHELLRKDPETGAPKIKIFSTCKQTIRQIMGAKVHKTKPGDLDDTRNSDGHWDILDALRYGVMSRPRLQSFEHSMRDIKRQNSWERINSYFN